MAIAQIIHLTQDHREPYPAIDAVQNDTGRVLKMIIDDETQPSGSTADLYFKRADVSFYHVSTTFVELDNAFTANIAQAITQAGTTECQLRVTQGDKIISTYTFLIRVQPAVDGSTATEQLGYTIDDIAEMVEEASEAAEAAVEAASSFETDKTLSQDNKPADALVTGDYLADARSVSEAMYSTAYTEIELPSLLSGYYIWQTNGDDAPSENWSFTPSFMPCGNYESLIFTCPTMTGETTLANVAAVAFYSASSESSFISSEPIVYGTNGGYRTIGVDIPATAQYMRLSVYTSSASGYKMFGCGNRKDYRYIELASDAINEDIAPTTWVSDYYARGDQGGIVSSSDWDCSNYIPIDGDAILVSCPLSANNAALSIVAAVAFYNEQTNSGFMSAQLIQHGAYGDTTPMVVPVPGGAKYIRVSRPADYSGDYTLRQLSYPEKTYYVGANEEYTSFTACLVALKDDKRPKKIIVRGGEYNIFSELKALVSAGKIPAVPADGTASYDPSTDYFDYCVFIPDNTHVIGEGYVRFIYTPSASDTTVNESKTWSPVNVAGSMTLENVEIYCTNGRYAIHDDPVQKAEYTGAIKKYINVTAKRGLRDSKNGTTLGYAHCFGCGVPRENTYIFDNCHFETTQTSNTVRTIYFHNRRVVGGVSLTKAMSSRIVLKNTTAKNANGTYGIFFGNIGQTGTQVIRVDIDNCWTNGNIVSADESDASTGTQPNTFDISVMNSVYNSVIVRDANNTLPPTIYGALS